MKLEELNETAREQEAIDRNESIDDIIDNEDYYDLGYGMGIQFVSDEAKKKYPKLANKIVIRVDKMLKNNR